jgi:DNA-binding Xre family transcriptional regulator
MKEGELCRLAGVSKTTLAKLGKGKRVTVDTLEKMCSVLSAISLT